MRALLSALALSLLASSCTSTTPREVIRPYGAITTIDAAEKHVGELLAVTDSSLVLLEAGALLQVPLHSVQELKIPRYPSPGKREVNGMLGLFYLGSSLGYPPSLLFAAIGIGTALYTPAYKYKAPFFYDELQRISLRSRYPQGLSPQQLQQLGQHLPAR